MGRIEVFMPAASAKGGRPFAGHRMVVEPELGHWIGSSRAGARAPIIWPHWAEVP